MKHYHSDAYCVVRQTCAKDFEGITALCRRVYPFGLPWGEDQLSSHQAVFPQGQLVIEERATGTIIGMAASLIVNWDDYEIEDAWRDFTDHGYFRNHDAEKGRTLYAAEVMVDPACQGRGLGKLLYAARRTLTRDLGLLRIRSGARLRGYSRFAPDTTPLEYLLKITQGTEFDPTISFQMKQGFHIMALVKGYLPHDPETLGWAVAIEWLNPEVADPEDRVREARRYERLFNALGEDGAALYEAVCARMPTLDDSILVPSD